LLVEVPKNNKPASAEQSLGKLELFHPAVRDWFESVFAAPTRPQSAGWPAIARNAPNFSAIQPTS
jgi:Lhr-like helicase